MSEPTAPMAFEPTVDDPQISVQEPDLHGEALQTAAPSSPRAGLAAVIGAPNAGKSTLVNRLVGAKVSIVTRKVQTTRFPVRGVALEGDSQVVLIDTPGLFTPRRRLDRAMVHAAWAGAQEAEVIVHVIDAEGEIAVVEGTSAPGQRRSHEDDVAVRERLRGAGLKAVLALNKVDAVRREKLLALAQSLFDAAIYTELFMVSAETGSGVADLKKRLGALMPAGPWLYPADQTADLPARLLAAEITREKLYLRVHEELPYAAAVETTAFEERADGSVRIEQTVYVERDGQRAILLGKGGQTLKWIGQKSREDLGQILGGPVHLFLHVKVMENWQERRDFYQDTGLDFDAR
jgi:GTP-binding protein Era